MHTPPEGFSRDSVTGFYYRCHCAPGEKRQLVFTIEWFRASTGETVTQTYDGARYCEKTGRSYAGLIIGLVLGCALVTCTGLYVMGILPDATPLVAPFIDNITTQWFGFAG